MIRVFIFVVLCFLLSSCTEKKAPDVSSIAADVHIVRTENEVAGVRNVFDFQNLIRRHPAFYDIYLKKILPLDQVKIEDSLYRNFDAFIKDSLVSELFVKVSKKYGNIDDIKKDAEQMYRYLRFYFPDKAVIPDIYTFISEYAFQIFIFEDEKGKDGIALGLDMFMRPEIDYKVLDPDNTNFSDYITRSWNKDHIVKKVADLHISDILGEAPGHRLLDEMIHNGKALYISRLLLPTVHDSILLEYTGKQTLWCKENELQMWSFFFNQKLFFESNPAKIGKYINPSPKSPDMPDDAPGRTANFIGWQIVSAYMARYPDTTLKSLIDNKDSQSIMEKSRYKPRQK
jgi:hypothetical protein